MRHFHLRTPSRIKSEQSNVHFLVREDEVELVLSLRAAQTELSIPPETATTQPLRRRVAETISRILRGIPSAASAKSKSSQG
jgi:hypothetical protein